MAWTTIRSRRPKRLRPVHSGLLLLALSTSLAALSISGCRITNDDVHGWAKKVSGPRKLLAVVRHDKYSGSLRTNAAMTLVTMPPRGGTPIGLVGGDEFIGLLEGLHKMPIEDRDSIVIAMVPHLVEGMRRVPHEKEVDTSYPFKDATFALLHYENDGLISDPVAIEQLKEALSSWCQHDFVAKMDNTSQLYGMELVLRYVGAPGVKNLTHLFTADFKKMPQLARLIAELGDEATKQAASSQIATVAKTVNSATWVKGKTEAVEAANKSSGLVVTSKQLEKQLKAYQAEELNRVFVAMKIVGGKASVDYLIAFANDKTKLDAQRAAALAALEKNLQRDNPAHAKAMLDLLSSDDTPDLMRDVAARRIGELSRPLVAKPLYELFDHKRWQLRWSVASLLLKLSESADINEFMTRLGKIEDMAITEPFSYGKLLGEVKGVVPEDLLSKYARKSFPAPVRLSALGYYYDNGTRNDLSKVEAFVKDNQEVPSCRKEATQCSWECTVPGKTSKDKAESRTIKTVGNFVEYCLMPAMSKREPIDNSDSKKKVTERDPTSKK